MLDASVTLAWAFEDEADGYSDSVLGALANGEAVAPGLWSLEVANVLAVGERRGRLTPADSARFVALLESLPIRVEIAPESMGEIVTLARETHTSAYDAAYLALAMRRGLPIATRGAALAEAASTRGVAVFGVGDE